MIVVVITENTRSNSYKIDRENPSIFYFIFFFVNVRQCYITTNYQLLNIVASGLVPTSAVFSRLCLNHTLFAKSYIN